MGILTVYLDNSVLGGYFDSEFEEPTRRLWRMAEAGKCRFVASVITQREARRAPLSVIRLFARTFPDDSALLGLTPRAEELAASAGAAQSRQPADTARGGARPDLSGRGRRVPQVHR